MAKSIDDLRKILQRMQEQLEKTPSRPQPEPEPPLVKAPPQQAPAPVKVYTPPLSKPAPSPVMGGKSVVEAAGLQTPRLLRDDEPIPHRRNVEDVTRIKRSASANFLRFAALGTAIGVGLAGLFLDNRTLVFVGFAGLAVCIAWPVKNNDMQELGARVAALERRVSSLSLPAASAGMSAGLAEELEELRTMVKSLYKAIEEVPLDPKGEHDEGMPNR